MSDLSSEFYLPQSDPGSDAAANESAEQEARWNAAVGEAIPPGRTPEEDAAAIQNVNAANRADTFRAAGMFVSNIGTKAVEGIKDIGNRFSNAFPFSKAGAKTPTFQELTNPATLQKAVGSVVGSVFGKSGLLSSQQQAAAVAKTVPTTTASELNAVTKISNADEDRSHIVTLTDMDQQVFEFLVMPEIVENRSVDYEAVAPAQFPGAFQKYKGTQSVQWTINATLIARTSEEATLNLRNLNMLRGWTMPFFGENTAKLWQDRIGAPPQVLKLKGLRKGIIGEVPVVITSLSWNWPKDVDYIPASSQSDPREDNIPFPTVLQIAIQMIESFSTTEFNQFDLRQYYLGNFKEAYSKKVKSLDNNNGKTSGPPVTQEAQETNSSWGREDRGLAVKTSWGAETRARVPALTELRTIASSRPPNGRNSQLFKKNKGWIGPEPGAITMNEINNSNFARGYDK